MSTHSQRYDRQTILPEIGLSGQQKLHAAKVLVIGAGGLGCPVLQNLAGAGVGLIGIVDGDAVEETNLHRQFLYTTSDCGKNKAAVAAATVLKQNPQVTVIPFAQDFTPNNAFEIVKGYDIIVDCTDHVETRYLINDVSLAKGIPMVYASVHKFEGQLSVFNFNGGPSYRCLFPETESLVATLNCTDSGVLGVIPNTIGALQATEVFKILLDIGGVLSGVLLLYNGLHHTLQSIAFDKMDAEIVIGKQRGALVLRSHATGFQTIDGVSFIERIGQDSGVLIDLTETYECTEFHFPNAVKVSLEELDKFLETFDRNQQITLFCMSGTRSGHAANYLVKSGFTNILHLGKGLNSLNKISVDD